MSPKKIAQLMKDLNLTQEEFGKLVGAHRVTVANWVRGAAKPKGLYLRALEELAAKSKKTAKMK